MAEDNNYKQSWGGINLFNSKDNGASVKTFYAPIYRKNRLVNTGELINRK